MSRRTPCRITSAADASVSAGDQPSLLYKENKNSWTSPKRSQARLDQSGSPSSTSSTTSGAPPCSRQDDQDKATTMEVPSMGNANANDDLTFNRQRTFTKYTKAEIFEGSLNM